MVVMRIYAVKEVIRMKVKGGIERVLQPKPNKWP